MVGVKLILILNQEISQIPFINSSNYHKSTILIRISASNNATTFSNQSIKLSISILFAPYFVRHPKQFTKKEEIHQATVPVEFLLVSSFKRRKIFRACTDRVYFFSFRRA